MRILLLLLSLVAVAAHGQGISQRVTTLESDVDAIEVEQAMQNGRLDALEAAPGGAPATFGYVGFSTATVDGAAGFAAMAQACQIEFPDSRIARRGGEKWARYAWISWRVPRLLHASRKTVSSVPRPATDRRYHFVGTWKGCPRQISGYRR